MPKRAELRDGAVRHRWRVPVWPVTPLAVPYEEPEDFRPEQRLEPPTSGPMSWEDGSLPWYQRLSRTLRAAFAPIASLRAAASGDIAPALRFALLSGLPTMMLWAVIPYTHRLAFEFAFHVKLLPGSMPIELDVVRAMAIGLAYTLLSQLAWTVPFVSLLKSYADGSRAEDPKRAGWRTALYRMWVVPLGMLLYFLIPWSLPIKPDAGIAELMDMLMRQMPRILLFVHCHVMARYFGASGFGAMVVGGVPQLVQQAASLFLDDAAIRLLPAMPPP